MSEEMSGMLKIILALCFPRIALKKKKKERGQRFKGVSLFLYLLLRSGKRAQ
jgi:hypothetical protein